MGHDSGHDHDLAAHARKDFRLHRHECGIVVANLTETAQRRKVVDFVTPKDRTPIREVIVTGPTAPQLGSLDDLAGRTICARRSSSSRESLAALDARLRGKRLAGPKILAMPEPLGDPDALEPASAGALDLSVVGDGAPGNSIGCGRATLPTRNSRSTGARCSRSPRTTSSWRSPTASAPAAASAPTR
jgi:hypothetical protein